MLSLPRPPLPRPKQKEEVDRARTQVHKLLKKCDPEFFRSLLRVMARESLFVQWKRDEREKDPKLGADWFMAQLPSAVLGPAVAPPAAPAAPKPPPVEDEEDFDDEAARAAKRHKRVTLGDATLDDFWNLHDDNLNELGAEVGVLSDKT